jgi:hypothetical protein
VTTDPDDHAGDDASTADAGDDDVSTEVAEVDDAQGDASGDVVHLGRDVAAFGPRLTLVEDRVEELAGGLDAVEALINGAAALLAAPADAAGPAPAGSGAEDGAEATGLDMRVLVDWVANNVAYLLERRVPQSSGFPRWCPRWWLHPEAIARFEALRRMWTSAVGDPQGGLVIYFEHLDQMMAVLGAEYGPFAYCNPKEGHAADRRGTFLGQEWPDAAYFAEIEGDLGTVHTLPVAGA